MVTIGRTLTTNCRTHWLRSRVKPPRTRRSSWSFSREQSLLVSTSKREPRRHECSLACAVLLDLGFRVSVIRRVGGSRGRSFPSEVVRVDAVYREAGSDGGKHTSDGGGNS